MNVSVSKILLGVSIAAYTYCSWDHLSSSKKPDDGPAKPLALTAAMVNHVEVLALGRDAFESIAIDRGDPNAEALITANATAANGASNAASMGGGSFDGLSLQGIFMTPAGHAALINGIPVAEGEAVVIPGGPKIFARTIGEDYAVIEAWGRQKKLKLDDPPPAAAPAPAAAPSSPSATPSYTAPPRPAAPSAPAASSNPNPAGHGGGSDPYAGHKTHH